MVVFFLLISSVILAFSTKFLSIRSLFKIKSLLNLKKDDIDLSDNGSISPFKALFSSISGTIGIGNIAGSAILVKYCGAGSLLWILIFSFVSINLKFCEIFIGHLFRKKASVNNKIVILGGPFYYIKEAFSSINLPKLAIILSFGYAFILGVCSLFLSSFQMGQIVSILNSGIDDLFINKTIDLRILISFILGFLTFVIMLKGLKLMSDVSSFVVPFMSITYLFLCFYVIYLNSEFLPTLFKNVILQGLNIETFGKTSIVFVIMNSLKRVMFATECGVGSSTIFHSSSDVKKPINQASIGILDAASVCLILILSCTAMLSFNEINHENEGVLMFKDLLRKIGIFPVIIFSISAFLFGFSTIISNSFYYISSMKYMFKDKIKNYKYFYLLYFIFISLFCHNGLHRIINIADSMFIALSIPNCIAVIILSKYIKKDN